MSALQMDIGGGTNLRFAPYPTPTSAHPNNNNGEEVAIDYSKSSLARMSAVEGQAPVIQRVPTKGMRKAYPEDKFAITTPPISQLQQMQQLAQYSRAADDISPLTKFPKIMDEQPHPSPYVPYSHEDSPSPYYPTPPPQQYNNGNAHHHSPAQYHNHHHPPPPHHQHHQPPIPPNHNHNRFNFNVYQQELNEDVREYQCLKCGLFFSCESYLHMHYTQDHGFGAGGERSSTSSTSSCGGGGGGNHHHHINNRSQHNNSTGSSRASAVSSHVPDMFCDKCQLRFHCLLSFRVHQHEHVLPNVQPHYPMSNSHLLSLSYTCEICGANFMSRESLTDHANAHLYEHVCSESTCGGEISDHSTATNSSEEFFHLHQREQQQQQIQAHHHHYNNYQQRNCYPQSQMENVDHHPLPHHPSHPHQPPQEHSNFQPIQNPHPQLQQHPMHPIDRIDNSLKVEEPTHPGPSIYDYSTPSPDPYTSSLHQESNQQHEISAPISSSKLAGGGGIYEPLIVMDNGKRRFQCMICKKYLSSRIAHEEHTRGKHTGDKPYSCSYCGKRFAVWNTYKHHMGTHKGGLAPPLQKCILCDKKFKTVECLRTHQREHHMQNGELVHSGGGGDESSGGGGGGGSGAVGEGNTNSGGGGYSCQICGKTFVRKMWRTRHYLSHAGQNCFRCELCSCILPDEQSYRMHHESHKVSN